MNTEARQGIRQKDYMIRNGISPLDIKAFRDKNLRPDEWWKDGVSIMWDVEAVKRLDFKEEAPTQIVAEDIRIEDHLPTGEDPAADVHQQIREARAFRPCRNKRMLLASLDGVLVPVNCGKFRDKLLKKNIKIKPDENGETYTYVP